MVWLRGIICGRFVGGALRVGCDSDRSSRESCDRLDHGLSSGLLLPFVPKGAALDDIGPCRNWSSPPSGRSRRGPGSLSDTFNHATVRRVVGGISFLRCHNNSSCKKPSEFVTTFSRGIPFSGNPSLVCVAIL